MTRLRSYLVCLLLLMALVWLPLPGNAQETAPASYGILADLLENPQSRDQLIQELRRLAGDPPAAPAAAPTRSLLDVDLPGSQISWRLQRLASELQTNFSQTVRLAGQIMRGESVPGISMQRSLPALQSLALALLVVVLTWHTLHIVLRATLARLEQWVARKNREADTRRAATRRRTSLHQLTTHSNGRKLIAVILAFALNLLMIGVSALAGYGSVVVAPLGGPMSALAATQFLTAFMVVQGLKTISIATFSPNYPGLRLLPMPTGAARFWNRWLGNILGITGYTLLLVVPMIQALMIPALGHILGLFVMTAVYVYATNVIWSRRHIVRRALEQHADDASAALSGTLLRVLARTWHWLVIAYFSVLFIVSQTDSQEALGFMGQATAQTLIALLVGSTLIAMVSNRVARRIELPHQWRRTLPSLEARINAYVPAFLRGVRLFIFIATSLVILDAWHAFNLADWLFSTQAQAFLSTILHIAIILLIAAISWTVLAAMIEHRLGKSGGPHGPTEREKTLLMLLRSAAAVTITTLTTLVVLSQIGIDIGPLVAGAGVAGLAIGFGAQKLVQDVITGIFIQLENGMNQNDVVQVAGLFGTVERISIRSVVIRTMDGGYHLIPFSAIDKLANHTRDYGYHYGEYRIAHRESVEHATAQLRAAFEVLKQDPKLAPELLDDISLPGVTSLDERGFTLRVLIKTTPGNQWAIQRAFNRLVKEHFDAAGIEIPYPQTVVHFGRDRHGHAAPVDVRQLSNIEDALFGRNAPGQTRRVATKEAGVEPTPGTET
ncbi:MAG: mechanosensitive ion channel domain-containing protein [Castellaniella sp.]